MTQAAKLMGSIARTAETLQQAAQTCVDVKQELEDNFGGLKNTADQALAKAEGALPKSGGEMTGTINIKCADIDVDSHVAATKTCNGFIFDNAASNFAATMGIQQFPDNSDFHNVLALYNYLERKVNDQKITAVTSLRIDEDGKRWLEVPPPRDVYGPDAVTMKALMDYAPRKLTQTVTIHVGGANASDTADLNNGRGLSADKPFASLVAAKAWAYSSLNNVYDIIFLLHESMTVSEMGLGNYGGSSILKAASLEIALTISQRVIISGYVRVENITLNGQNADSLFLAGNSLAFLEIGAGVKFTGSAQAVLVAQVGGTIKAANDMSGNITGKKYASDNGGHIYTLGKEIPGTIAGTGELNK